MKKLHARMAKRLGAGGAVAAWFVGGTAIVAAAAILLMMAITGSVTVTGGPALTYVSATATTDGSGIKCVPTISTDKKSLAISVSDAMAGATCDFTTAVAADKTGFVTQDLTLGANLPIEKSTTSAVCNVPLTDSYLGGALLKWRLTVPENATAGTISIPAGSGVKVVPAGQYSAAACTVK